MLCSCSVFPYGTFCGTEYHHAGEKDAPGEANNNLEISKSKVFKNGKEMQHIFCKMMLISPVFVVVVWFHVCIRWSTYTIWCTVCHTKHPVVWSDPLNQMPWISWTINENWHIKLGYSNIKLKEMTWKFRTWSRFSCVFFRPSQLCQGSGGPTLYGHWWGLTGEGCWYWGMYGRETVWFIRCYTYKYICAYIYIYIYIRMMRSVRRKKHMWNKNPWRCVFSPANLSVVRVRVRGGCQSCPWLKQAELLSLSAAELSERLSQYLKVLRRLLVFWGVQHVQPLVRDRYKILLFPMYIV